MTEQRIVLPRVAETGDESYVAEFIISAGDTVAVDQTILKVETAKATVDIVSTHAGVLTEWLVEMDQEISTGTEIAVISVA